MTIIQPGRRFQIGLTQILLIVSVIAAVILNIYFYNSIVNLKYSLNEQTKFLQKAQIASADLKNNLYKTLDSNNLLKLANQLSLVKETKPIYLEFGVPVAAGNVSSQ